MSSKAVADFLADIRSEPATAATPAKRQWKALMGQVLEYGDSGFQIVLNKRGHASTPFQLRDPEGRVMGEGTNLDSMKRAAEDQARMRDEFAKVDTESFSTLPKFGGTSHGGEQ